MFELSATDQAQSFHFIDTSLMRYQMTHSLDVIPATASYRPALIELYRQLCSAHGVEHSPAEAASRLERILSAPYECSMILDTNGVIGSGIWMEMGDHVFLRQFTIDVSRRRQGFGSQAFSALATAYFEEREIELSATNLKNGPIEFWTRLGFKPVGTTMRRTARI